jgi:mannose-6-phosphate isomerase-like protein (cupin superfamily)
MVVPMSAYRTIALDDIPPRPDADTGADWLPLRDALGVRAFGVNAWRAPAAGVEVIERHNERNPDDQEHEELYVVVRGRARFEIGGETLDAPAGTAVFIPDPGAERRAVAEEAGTLILTVGAEPGTAFEVSGWERRELTTGR